MLCACGCKQGCVYVLCGVVCCDREKKWGQGEGLTGASARLPPLCFLSPLLCYSVVFAITLTDRFTTPHAHNPTQPQPVSQACYSLAWGIGYFVLMAELFPLATRSLAMSLTQGLTFCMYRWEHMSCVGVVWVCVGVFVVGVVVCGATRNFFSLCPCVTT